MIMLTDVTIEQAPEDKILVLPTFEAKKKYTKSISISHEVVDVGLTEEFLTAAGMGRALLDEEHARSKARKAISSSPPKQLKELYEIGRAHV
jgi:hypothetical protein